MQQWRAIRRAVLVDGMSKRQACREFGIHWETLRKVLAHPAPPGYRRVARVDHPVMGPWMRRLAALLEQRRGQPRKQRYTVKRIFDILRGEGFPGGYTTVKDAVRELNLTPGREVFLPLRQPPGEAQVDFGEALANIGGVLQKIHFFVMSLVHSDAMFVMAFPRECTEAFMEAHVHAFAFFGFVPTRITYDNSRIPVARIIGPHERTLTPAFEALLGHALFEPHFCNVRRANEKGVVEGAVRYSRVNFMVPVPQAEDYDQLNRYLLECCRNDQLRRVRGKTLTKRELLAEDRCAGIAIPPGDFEYRKVTATTASNQSLVRFSGNAYSVPVECAYRPVTVKASAMRVWIEQAGEIIATHRRCWERDQEIFDPRHYLSLLERKPGGLEHCRPMAQWDLPPCFERLQRCLEAQRPDGRKEYIRILMLLREYPIADVAAVIDRLDLSRAPTAEVIRQRLVPPDRPELQTFRLAGRTHLAGVRVATTNLQQYGQLREVRHA